MAETMYFQWQNDILLKTIYPLREMKLIDFLVYYREIDLWAEYKDRRIEDLADEVNAFQAAKKKSVTEAVDRFNSNRDYFLKTDVRMEYVDIFKPGAVDEGEMAKINALHGTFITYFPGIKDPRKETYFISQRLLAWEQHLKDLQQMIAQKQGYLNRMLPDHKDRHLRTQELETLRTVIIPMAEIELKRLRAFLSASNNIGKRKLELVTQKQTAQKNKPGIESRLMPIRQHIGRLEAQQTDIEETITRLRTPPDLATVQKYFSVEDVTDQIRSQFQQVEQKLLNSINGFHKGVSGILSGYKEDAVKVYYIKTQISNMQQFQRNVARGTAGLDAKLKDDHVKAVAAELGRLNDLKAALERSIKSQVEWDQLIQDQEREKVLVVGKLSQFRKDAEGLQKQRDSIAAVLNIDEQKYLVEFPPTQPTIKEIVKAKVEEYKASLSKKNHQELLQEVVQRFQNEPERFPRWLQYMVIHFSGMRYASAHGSWADPKDLLVSLQTLDIEKRFRTMDDNAIEGLCREKIEIYEPSGITFLGSTRQPTKLAQTISREWKGRIAYHLTRLKRGLDWDSPGHQRKALLDLRLDEITYEAEALKPEEAAEALLSYKDNLPEWMWKEIVRLTNLRVKEVNDPKWEKLTPQEQAQQLSKQDAEYREIMNQWKQMHVTTWREEHDRSDKLIVTRAVCNEVAEHIQHLRGHTPPGGLTAKAPWYIKNEREGKIPGTPRPYFVRPDSKEDYAVGASILWLRFVRELPNVWRIARPLQTKEGHGLIPAGFLSRKAGKNGYWVYTQGEVVKRTRTWQNEKKQTVRDEQWLRWIHEATVAAVAETAEGTVVLTFETALPEEDRSRSCIGVFKHYLNDIKFDGGEDNYNGSFVGFVPEGQVNEENLKDMLDWDKILSKPVG